MASERDEARADIQAGTELDISGPIDSATQVKLLIEKNKQARRLARGQRGLFGIFGDQDHAPILIAFLAMIIGMALGTWCLYQGSVAVADHDFWSKQADRAFVFATTALGYLFGRGTK